MQVVESYELSDSVKPQKKVEIKLWLEYLLISVNFSLYDVSFDLHSFTTYNCPQIWNIIGSLSRCCDYDKLIFT